MNSYLNCLLQTYCHLGTNAKRSVIKRTVLGEAYGVTSYGSGCRKDAGKRGSDFETPGAAFRVARPRNINRRGFGCCFYSS